jgi:nucleoside phosphorylase
MSPQIDVLLICALKDEFDQVLNVTDGLILPGWKSEQGPKGWLVSMGTFETSNDESLTICASWASHMGREQAQGLASLLYQNIPAKCVAMSGICAGRRGKVSLGDVILADRLWSYDAGKITVEDGERNFAGDMVQFSPPRPWVQRMQNISISGAEKWLRIRPQLTLEYQEQWATTIIHQGTLPQLHPDFSQKCPDWADVVTRLKTRKLVNRNLELTDAGRNEAGRLIASHPKGLPAPRPFRLHVAPIATGAAVIEDEGLFPHLAESMRKVLGVDMEASALATFADFHDIPVLVAKGVSDCGDTLKDDRYREFAARASAEVLISLFRQSKDLLLVTEQSPPTIVPNSDVPLDLIKVFAEEYPDTRDARALWERAGGKRGEVESISRPRDLWQRLWKKSVQGASVTPEKLLQSALEDLPKNTILLKYLNK